MISVAPATELPANLERPNSLKGGETRYFVAYLDAVPIGSITLAEDDFPIARVLDHYVDPEFRNLGAGELLLESAITWAGQHGYGEITATIPTRDRLIKLTYESQGFKAVTLTVRRSLQ